MAKENGLPFTLLDKMKRDSVRLYFVVLHDRPHAHNIFALTQDFMVSTSSVFRSSGNQ
jgi:hypothetical protein